MESTTYCEHEHAVGYDAALIRAGIPEPHRPHFRRAVREAGITKKVTPHTFRHSAATHLLQAGYDIRQVQEFLGHTDIRTTMIYLHILKNEQKPLRSPLDILRENESQTRKGGTRQDKTEREANCRNWPA